MSRTRRVRTRRVENTVHYIGGGIIGMALGAMLFVAVLLLYLSTF